MEERSAEYIAEYARATEELDKQERPRGADGKFVKAEETPPVTLPEKQAEPVKTEPEQPAEAPAPDPMAELRAEIARLDKVAKDNQAWGTRNAQKLADFERQRDEAIRAANRPKIMDMNPELEAAIRYVAGPSPSQIREQEEAKQKTDAWRTALNATHSDVFAEDFPIREPELYKALESRMQALGDQWSDPMTAIREINAEKLAHAQRQADRRVAAEIARLTQRSAMSVPGSGSSSVTGGNADADAVARIRNMSDADFERERRKTLGY